MARPSYASFLPSIKCSSCGVEIEISAMGDHLCTGNPDDVQTKTGRTDLDWLPASYLKPPEQNGAPFLLDKREPVLPASEAGRGLDFGFTTPYKRPSPEPSPALLPTAAPGSSALPIPPRIGLPARSVTGPILSHEHPPSDHTTYSQNSQNSPFFTRKSLARPAAPHLIPFRSYSGTDPTVNSSNGPLSPSVSSGANLLKRMDSITPGPFGSRSRKDGDKNGPRSPLPAAAESKRGTSPAAQHPQRPPRPGTDDSLCEDFQITTDESVDPTYLAQTEPKPMAGSSTIAQGAETGKTEEAETEPVGPLPRFSQSNRGHSLTESESSAASQSISDSRTASSRSSHSPLTSSTSLDQNYETELNKEHAPLRAVLEDTTSPRMDEFGTADATTRKMSSTEDTSNSNSDATPQQDQGIATHRRLDKLTTIQNRDSNASISQLSPDSELRLSSLRYDPNERNGRASGPLVPAPSHLGSKRRPAAPKSKCRGCGTPIIGKSIKAADGRLSGRWHRECFTCHTCQSPFQTTDFYVLNNQPYCSHHYHELNHSLCHHCNNGIEGKYLEIQRSQKYHMDCFTCYDCHKPLTKDYFEMNNQVFCETDAYRVWQKSKMLTPGKRFPERRQTRMMTMS